MRSHASYERGSLCRCALLLAAAACGGGTPEHAGDAAPRRHESRRSGHGRQHHRDDHARGHAAGAAADQDGAPIRTASAGRRRRPTTVVVGTGGALQNVFVYVKDGLGDLHVPGAGDAGGARSEGLPLRAARARHPGRPDARDPATATRRCTTCTRSRRATASSTRRSAVQGMKHTHTFSTHEVMVPFKCDVHSWMSAYVGVLDHPFFAVTGADGAFELKGLPPGTYTIEAWHEKLGTQTQTVTIGAKETEGRRVHVQDLIVPCSLHLFAVLVALSTAVLIFAGGLVTSTGSGLSVPDWPNTYGWFMFTFPLEKMVGGIRYEHTPPADREHGRVPDHGAGRLAVARRAAALGAPARLRRARRGDHAGHARRHHRAVVPARSDLDRPRQPGAARLLPDGDHRAGDVAGMAARLRAAERGRSAITMLPTTRCSGSPSRRRR